MSLMSKHDLTTQELQMLSTEMDKKKKSNGVAWALWWFTGIVGGHRYYLGNYASAILMTCTLGCLGIWTLIDIFFISGLIRGYNERTESKILEEIRAIKIAKVNDENQVTM